tara:strand:- start:4811 stop:6703 length:1893 start_codon:yes stop_codon:yes gene_type:complete
VTHVIGLDRGEREEDEAWARMRDSPQRLTGIEWLKPKGGATRTNNSATTTTVIVEAELIASHAFEVRCDATLSFSWPTANEKEERVLKLIVEAMGVEVYCGTFTLRRGRGEIAHDARVQLPFFRFPAPALDAKLEQALQRVETVVMCDACTTPAIYSITLPETSVDDIWHVLRAAPALIGALHSFDVVEAEEESDTNTRLVVDVVVSRRMRLNARATLDVSYDDQARTVDVSTHNCAWGTIAACLHVETDGARGCTVSFEARFEACFPLHYLLSPRQKLNGVAAQLECALRDAMKAKRRWLHAFLDSFEPLVLRPLLNVPTLAPALCFEDVATHLEKMLRHTCTGGKAYRPLLLRLGVRVLGGAVDDRLLHGVGWALEAFQAAALVWDDIMDRSDTRRGKPCWHRVVGESHAINDGVSLYALSLRILEHHLRERPQTLQKMLCTHNDTTLQTCVGQYMDVASEGDRSAVCRKRYDAIVQCKTAAYTVYQPVAFAILLCELDDEQQLLQNADTMAQTVGCLFQEADDYLDLYGDPKRTGKVLGTDVVDGKLTWMIAYALEHADAAQAEELRALYGSDANVSRVSAIFEALGVHEEYERRQREMRQTCMRDVCARLKPLVRVVLSELTRRQA